MASARVSAVIVGVAGVLVSAVALAMCLSALPSDGARMGSDYAYFLPRMFDAVAWVRENGWGEVQWFTPSFCGGLPVFPNPQSSAYSLFQIASMYVSPVTAIRITVFVFALLGFLSMYRLARDVFATSHVAAALGGALFAGSGFYVHRLREGHLTFHAFMLTPLLAWACLRPRARRDIRGLSDVAVGATVVAYMLYGGAPQLVLSIGLAVVALAALRGCLHGGFGPLEPRLWAAIALGGSVAAAKLVAGAAYLSHVPRTPYPVPGVASLFDTIALGIVPLFWRPDADALAKHIVNTAWKWGAHEFEISIGLGALAVILAGAAFVVRDAIHRRARGALPRPRLIAVAFALVFALVLLVPLVFNVHTPLIAALLPRVPLLRASQSLFRLTTTFVPVAAIGTAILFDRIPLSARARVAAAIACVGVLAAQNAFEAKRIQSKIVFDARELVSAHNAVLTGAKAPPITALFMRMDAEGRFAMPIWRDAVVARGLSQVACIEPLFGYRLETFPVRGFRPGPMLSAEQGTLNVSNPSCFVFPNENQCEPGDPFEEKAEEAAAAFLARKPFPFEMPPSQHLANEVTRFSLALLACMFVGSMAIHRLKSRRSRAGPKNP